MKIIFGLPRNILLSIYLFVILSCSKAEMNEKLVPESDSGFTNSSYEIELFEAINSYRIENGLPGLLLEKRISAQAKKHNEHMISKKEICHHFFGARYKALSKSTGAKAASENVAFGYNSAGAVVKAWVNSKGHRKNMEGNFPFIGISAMQDGNDRFYYTAIFVRK